MNQIINVVDQLIQHPTKRWQPRAAAVDCFCVHHSATTASVTLEAIARYHVETKDMAGIQYHYVIGADGVIYQTQPDALFVWHGNDWNTGLGVCLLGDFTLEPPPQAQLDAARWLLAQKRAEYGHLLLVGHREAPSAVTSCPGDTWKLWRGELEKQEGTVGEKHLLTVHLQRNAELKSEPTETIRNSRLPFYKAMDPDAWGDPPNVMFPGKRCLTRLHFGGSTGDAREHELMRRGAEGAREYIRLMEPRITKCIAGGVRDFEGPNEIHAGAVGNPWEPFIAFQWELARYYVGRGCRYWALSLGVGWFPDEKETGRSLSDIVRFKDLLLYCAANGGGLAVHEYGCPSVLSGDGWWTMRVRKTLDALYAAGVPRMSIPVAITEAGITWALRGDADTGYNSHSSWHYEAEYGLPAGGMTRERVFAQMCAYEQRIVAEVPEVWMIAWFTTLPFADWITFDVNTTMCGWVVALHADTPTEPPVEPPPPTLEQQIGDAIQQHIIPLNPNAALEKAGMALGLLPASDEVRDVAGYVAQAFRSPGEREWQHIAYCADGDWANVRWFRRSN